MIITEVILFLPIKTTFFYCCHPYLNPFIGSIVQVPFKNKISIGIISKIFFSKEKKYNKSLKYLSKILNHKCSINKTIIYLLTWTSTYYHYPIGTLTFNVIPKLFSSNIIKKKTIYIGQLQKKEKILTFSI